MTNRAPRIPPVEVSTALGFVGVIGCVVALAASIGDVRGHAARDRAQLHALIACVENTAYTRSLIGQCLDDYRESGRR